MTAIKPIDDIRNTLAIMEPQFAKVLPHNVTPARFTRVVVTAIQNNQDLLLCDRGSLYAACMKAAEQGLLPDGREGAIVPYKNTAKWIPMIAGIRKLARNSGEISKWEVRVIKDNDEFHYEQGDNETIKHVPFFGGDRGETVGAYSVVTLRDGEKSREVMTIEEINKVRASSRAKFGPWIDNLDEMCKKTVARRHSKSLPMSTDKDETVRLVKAIESDDEDHDFSANKNEPAPVKSSRLSKLIESVGEGTEMPSVQEDEKFPLED